MITFKAFLAELFDKAAPVQHNSRYSDSERTVYTFNVDGNPYFIVYEPIVKTMVEVSFGIGNVDDIFDSISSRNSAFQQTNIDKDKFVVFATVIEATKQYAKKLPSGFELTFTAEGESRIKMYRMLANKLAAKYHTKALEMGNSRVKRFVIKLP